MHFSTAFALLASVVAASAKTIDVDVGYNKTLTFNPPSVNASVGDILAFTFTSGNHTLTQSTFASPCTNISASGVDSGYVPVESGATSLKQFSFTLNNASAPLWFYCRQGQHCQKGMVFAVNPTAAKSFDAFRAAAMGSAAAPVSGSSTATGSAPSTTETSTPSGARRLGGSAAGLLIFVGLVAGMTL